jgi:ABC-type dipeptide/oligopeptide/nickel transport system permease subunit
MNAVQAIATPAATPPTRATIWRRLLADRAAAVAALLLSVLIVAAILAPLIAPYDPYAINLGKAIRTPDGENWLGTDATGRDIFSRVLYGMRLTLLMGVMSVLVGGLLGAAIGVLAAFYKRIDGVVMRVIDMLLAFPAILIGLAAAAIFGPGLGAVIFALIFATVPDVARIARGAAVGVASQEFLEAGRAIGLSDRVLLWRYLALNCASTIFVFLTLRFGQVILIGSALGFLGLGAQPPTAELGMMAADGRGLLFLAPHIVTIPCIFIFLIVLAANVVGDALRDVLDPRLVA